MNITEIKKLFQESPVSEYDKLILQFSEDTREGVIRFLSSAKRKYDAYQAEIDRSFKMFTYERKYSDKTYICGIDEVGRGPLAGPVMATAVILPKDCDILYLNDSKQLSAKKREELYEEIMDKAVSVGVGIANQDIIDEINILNANYQAMRQAISELSVTPDLLLNDAVTIPDVSIQQVPIIKGDTLSASIAAASIIAKVTRDRLMDEYDKIYPQYGFASNKGYGSQSHIAAIREYGPCPIHRKTFIKNFINM